MSKWKCGKEPCRECPWRRQSAPGWLGSEQTPEEWVQTAHRDDTVECHVHGPLLCAGIAIYRANVSKKLRDASVPRLPPDKATVFAAPAEFVAHHRAGVVSSEIKHERSES